MDARAEAWKSIALYLGLVAVFSGLCDAIIVASGTLGAGRGMYTFALMWSPAAAALAVCRVRGIPRAELGWRWPTTRWILAGWLIPPAYCVVAYGVTWASGLGGFPDADAVADIARAFHTERLPVAVQLAWFILLEGTLGVIRSMVNALGEELGWRGLLVPQLARVLTPRATAVVSGVVWALYHLAVLVGADYNSGTPAWWGSSCFVVMVLATSFLMTWLRLRSASLWPCVLLHASHNLFVQVVFTPLTSDTGRTRWVVDEFGAALALTITACALAIWRRARWRSTGVDAVEPSDRAGGQGAPTPGPP